MADGWLRTLRIEARERRSRDAKSTKRPAVGCGYLARGPGIAFGKHEVPDSWLQALKVRPRYRALAAREARNDRRLVPDNQTARAWTSGNPIAQHLIIFTNDSDDRLGSENKAGGQSEGIQLETPL